MNVALLALAALVGFALGVVAVTITMVAIERMTRAAYVDTPPPRLRDPDGGPPRVTCEDLYSGGTPPES